MASPRVEELPNDDAAHFVRNSSGVVKAVSNADDASGDSNDSSSPSKLDVAIDETLDRIAETLERLRLAFERDTPNYPPVDPSKPVLHMVGLFHTVPNREWSHCAFTGKVLRFAKMMRQFGYKVVEYSNGDSESHANEHVQMLTRAELDEQLERNKKANPGIKDHGGNAVRGAPLHLSFCRRLVPEIKQRVRDGDIVCHPFGNPHQHLVADLKGTSVIHVESGIGYPETWCANRIYESSAWMHWHYGKGEPVTGLYPGEPSVVFKERKSIKDGKEVVEKGDAVAIRESRAWGMNYHFVAPNYFDLSEWEAVEDIGLSVNPLLEMYAVHVQQLQKSKMPIPSALQRFLNGEHVPYVGFLGRVYDGKGVSIIKEIADRMPDELFVLCGQGDQDKYIMGAVHHNVIGIQPITGFERSLYLGHAKCALMPTQFIEPFGGSGVETMLCGTPLITSNFGAFHETVEHGVTGYRAVTLGDWCEAIRKAPLLPRKRIAEIARSKYGLRAVGDTYDRIFRSYADLLSGKGFYSEQAHFV